MKVYLLTVGDAQSVMIRRSQALIAETVREFFPEAPDFVVCPEKSALMRDLVQALDAADLIAVCVDPSVYISTKRALMRVLQLNAAVDEEIVRRIREATDLRDDSLIAAHATIPEDAVALPTKDGLFSGFAISAGEQHLLCLPLELSRIGKLADGGVYDYLAALTGKTLPGNLDRALLHRVADKLERARLTVGFADNPTAVFASRCVKTHSVLRDRVEFTAFQDVERGDLSLKELAARVSDTVRQENGNALGAVISRVYAPQDGDDDSMFLFVAVSDEQNARVKKLYSRPGETPAQFVLAATQTAFEMLAEYGEVELPVQATALDLTQAALTEEPPVEEPPAVPVHTGDAAEADAPGEEKDEFENAAPDEGDAYDEDDPDEGDVDYFAPRDTERIALPVKILIGVAICALLFAVGYIGLHLMGVFAAAVPEPADTTQTAALAALAAVSHTDAAEELAAGEEWTEETSATADTTQATAAETSTTTATITTATTTAATTTTATAATTETTGTAAATAASTTTTKATTTKATTTKATTTKATTTKATTTKATTTKATTTKATTTKATTTKATTAADPLADRAFTFKVYGYGHGVGMSQDGAIALAKQGSDYRSILNYYYPGTTRKTSASVPETVRYGAKTFAIKDFLSSATGEEIGPGSPLEAIKAQMVAIYTLALDGRATACVCTGKYPYGSYANLDKAVDAVMGEYVSYRGDYAEVLFSASTGGCTATVSSAYGSDPGRYPYLVGGLRSPETVHVSSYTISAEDFKAIFSTRYPTMQFSDDPGEWIKILETDPAKNAYGASYISKIRVGGVTLTGNAFRSALGVANLKSHCFTFTVV